jgi:divalent metal cation (Fe/Co/Zn/Cd) transporter
MTCKYLYFLHRFFLSTLILSPFCFRTIVLNISFTSIFVFGALAIIKFQYSKKLKSPSLYKDGLCSLLGTILASALFVNTFIIEKYPQRWWLDPVVSILCGVAAFGIGVQAVWVASRVLPIFSAQWWLVSQGDSKIEMPKKEAEGEKSKLSEVV